MYSKLFRLRSSVSLNLWSVRLRDLFYRSVIVVVTPLNSFIVPFKCTTHRLFKSLQLNSFANHLIGKYLPNKMSLSSAQLLPAGPTDGSVVSVTSEDNNQLAGTVNKRDVATVFRNVQTQHGDYRSVDEENIVVLQRCLSPEPIRWLEDDAKEAAAISGDDEMKTDEIKSLVASSAEEQVVWIEPFHDVKVCSVYFCFLIV